MTEGTYEVEIPEGYLPLRATVERMTDQGAEEWTAIYTDVPCRKGKAKGSLLLGRDQLTGTQEIQNFVFNRKFGGVPLAFKPEDRLRFGSSPDYSYYRVSDIDDAESALHHWTITCEFWDESGDL